MSTPYNIRNLGPQTAVNLPRPGASSSVSPQPRVGTVNMPRETGGEPVYGDFARGMIEYKTQPLWHFQQVPAALTGNLQYFNVAVGANRWVTNMKQAAQLPGGIAYTVRRVAVFYGPECTPADVLLIANNGILVMQVAGLEVFEAPLTMLPGGGGVNFFSDGAAAAVDIINNGGLSSDGQFRLAFPIGIAGGQNFGVTVFFGAAGITVGAATWLGIFLIGEMYTPRPA